MAEACSICGCPVHRSGEYATPTTEGRSHASTHHYVAKRFLTPRGRIFDECPWNALDESGIFCYECHEELLHNPVLLREDIEKFKRLVCIKGLAENEKPQGSEMIGGRIKLFHEVIAAGIDAMLKQDGQS